MNHRNQSMGRALSIPAGLLWGGSVSTAWSIFGAIISAWLIHREMLPCNAIGWCAMLILLSAAYLGAMTAWGKIKHQRLLVCMLSGAVYLGILIAATALFFGGQYSGTGVSALVILAGSGTAALTGLGREGGRHGKTYKLPRL